MKAVQGCGISFCAFSNSSCSFWPLSGHICSLPLGRIPPCETILVQRLPDSRQPYILKFLSHFNYEDFLKVHYIYTYLHSNSKINQTVTADQSNSKNVKRRKHSTDSKNYRICDYYKLLIDFFGSLMTSRTPLICPAQVK